VGTTVLKTKEADQRGFHSNKEAKETVFSANGLLDKVLHTGGKPRSVIQNPEWSQTQACHLLGEHLQLQTVP